MDKVNVFKAREDLYQAYTELILSELKKKQTLNICLSGGSTPKALFQYWSGKKKTDIPWQNIRFFWGDERCVPPDHEESNFGMTRKFLLDHVDIPQENVFRILGENDPLEEAQRYEVILQDALPLKDGVSSFDVMMLGLGDDGHTASIFPHQIELWNSEDFCVVGTHPVSGQKRVSVTGRIINHSDVVTFLVTGESKKDIVREIVENKADIRHLYPAALVKPSSGRLLWFLDHEAAKKLK